MMRLGNVLLMGAFLMPLSLQAQKVEDGKEYLYFPSDQPPSPAEAEKVAPKAPFFSEPTTGNEVFEYVQELKHRLDKLEGAPGVITQKPDGTVVIESKGPIEIRTPSTITLDAKSVEMPKDNK